MPPIVIGFDMYLPEPLDFKSKSAPAHPYEEPNWQFIFAVCSVVVLKLRLLASYSKETVIISPFLSPVIL